jgi:hypothetical protein
LYDFRYVAEELNRKYSLSPLKALLQLQKSFFSLCTMKF